MAPVVPQNAVIYFSLSVSSFIMQLALFSNTFKRETFT